MCSQVGSRNARGFFLHCSCFKRKLNKVIYDAAKGSTCYEKEQGFTGLRMRLWNTYD